MPPPFPRKSAFNRPCSTLGCKSADWAFTVCRGEQAAWKGASPHPLHPWGLRALQSPLPSLLRKHVTPRAPGQRPHGVTHGSHLQLGAHLPAWLRDQTRSKNSSAQPSKAPSSVLRSWLPMVSPDIRTLLLLGWPLPSPTTFISTPMLWIQLASSQLPSPPMLGEGAAPLMGILQTN